MENPYSIWPLVYNVTGGILAVLTIALPILVVICL